MASLTEFKLFRVANVTEMKFDFPIKMTKNRIFIKLQKNTEVLKNDNEFIMHYSFHFRVFEPQI